MVSGENDCRDWKVVLGGFDARRFCSLSFCGSVFFSFLTFLLLSFLKVPLFFLRFSLFSQLSSSVRTVNLSSMIAMQGKAMLNAKQSILKEAREIKNGGITRNEKRIDENRLLTIMKTSDPYRRCSYDPAYRC